MNLNDVKLDKTAIQVYSSFEEADEDDRKYWQSRTPNERLEALELMRQSAYGYTEPTAKRLQRVLEIVSFP